MAARRRRGIITEDVTQKKIHKSSHAGDDFRDRLLVRLGTDNIELKATRRAVRADFLQTAVAENPGPRSRTAGLRTGKQHGVLFRQGCNTDAYVETDLGLSPVEIKNSESSPTCRGCGEIESVHLEKGCKHERVQPSHKNCCNRFKDAVGSTANQMNSHIAKEFRRRGKHFTPFFIYIDLCGGPARHDVGKPEDHKPSLVETVEAVGGKVIVFTHVPTDDELDSVIERLLSGV